MFPFKIALAQINTHVGNFESNSLKIIEQILKAKSLGAKLVVFPELALCGYPPRDFLEFDFFIDSCMEFVEKIAFNTKGIHVVLGAPSRNLTGEGKKLYNSAYHLFDGKIENVYHKTLLPNYDVFDEYRYFEPNHQFDVFHIEGHCFGVAICEDLWNVSSSKLYKLNPVEELKRKGAQSIINIAASPFSYVQHEKRMGVLRENAVNQQVNILYCNHVGAQTELIFDGGSLFMDNRGEVLFQGPFFKEQLFFTDAGSFENSAIGSKFERIHQALLLGIKEYFRKQNFTKAILGLSGGIDSAVTYALACQALGAENVLAVLLPSEFSSDHSISDAKAIVANFGGKFEQVNIASAYQVFNQALKPVFGEAKFDLTEENLQARIRGVYLMAISNKQGYILLNTSNKSEAAVGYGTLYGDMNGGISVLGDLYKTEVFELAKYMNRFKEWIPVNSINKAPSAELRPGQKDADSLPDYAVLDQILYQYIEQRRSLGEIVAGGFDDAMVKRVLNLVNRNEYKRYQTAPTLRVSEKAFGMGRRMPIVANYHL